MVVTEITEFLSTVGKHADEPAAWQEFDEIISRSGAFTMYREVRGEYIHPRIETEDKTARIDRILIPTNKLLDAGWKHGGAIGVEGKKSDMKAGPLVVQAIDYTRCAFRIERNECLIANVLPRWVFVYPVKPGAGDIASIMQRNRIGTVFVNGYSGALVFSCGNTSVITIYGDGLVKAKDTNIGNKRGSR